ncbi:MAG: flagellar hook-length control protein FliK [Actinomycetota bacterium]|nr:flagellar hook-length control protein FliK [Actinomycetota bacterium]
MSTGTVAGATTSTSSQPTGPVGSQVFPEVTRLVTRGDGTQRLTLRLSPENLGDVRIVVTVRDGAVDVTLAAGADAQEALRHGSPELRRLLENIGAASTQIAVRDLPTTQASSQTFGSGSGPAYSGSTGPGTNGRQQTDGDPAGQHAPPGRPGPTDHPTNHPTDQAPAAAGVDLRL